MKSSIVCLLLLFAIAVAGCKGQWVDKETPEFITRDNQPAVPTAKAPQESTTPYVGGTEVARTTFVTTAYGAGRASIIEEGNVTWLALDIRVRKGPNMQLALTSTQTAGAKSIPLGEPKNLSGTSWYALPTGLSSQSIRNVTISSGSTTYISADFSK